MASAPIVRDIPTAGWWRRRIADPFVESDACHWCGQGRGHATHHEGRHNVHGTYTTSYTHDYEPAKTWKGGWRD